jgi:REP element-mobilizing transposase RayT
MKFDPEIHHRRSIRLKKYDYSTPGAYFVTVCTHSRRCLFGEIVDGEMLLNHRGRIVDEEWHRSKEIRDEIDMDLYTIMPNHIHGIIIIQDAGATGRSPLQTTPPRGPSKRSLGAFIAGFKSITTKRINEIRQSPGTPVWQHNYYEHVIRNEKELDRVRQYIVENPGKWALDPENPAAETTTIEEPWQV